MLVFILRFLDIGPSVRVQTPVETARTINQAAYGYDADSDLEECEGETSLVTQDAFNNKSPPKQSSTVQCEFFDTVESIQLS
jgi:hypothetical protein